MDTGLILKSYKDITKVLNKNSPTILTGLGVAGLITTVILAVKATPGALENIEREKWFRYEEFHDETPLNNVDILEVTWKNYAPAALMGLATIGCIIGANHIHLRRNAALASLFSITETALREYQAQVAEKIGEKKEEIIRGEIAQKHLDNNPMQENTVILTGKGQYLCYDDFSSRYFRSDITTIQRAEIQFNQKLLREGWLGINEFYYHLGLDPIELGDEYGWIAERQLLEMKYSTKMAVDQEPCLVIGYMVTPHHI